MATPGCILREVLSHVYHSITARIFITASIIKEKIVYSYKNYVEEKLLMLIHCTNLSDRIVIEIIALLFIMND